MTIEDDEHLNHGLEQAKKCGWIKPVHKDSTPPMPSCHMYKKCCEICQSLWCCTSYVFLLFETFQRI